MRPFLRMIFASAGPALVLGFGLMATSRAEEEHDHGAPLHGGKVAMTKAYHFEVVFAKDGLKVYPRTHEDKPLDASKMTGTATFFHPNSTKPWFERPLAIATSPGQTPISLGASVDTSTFPVSGVKVALQVSGLPDPAELTATLEVPFTPPPVATIFVGRATPADAQAIAAQKTCPVSGEALGSMGGPWKVSRGGKSIFLCCKSCLKQVQADPDKFLGAPAAADIKGAPGY